MSYVNQIKDKDGTLYDINDKRLPSIGGLPTEEQVGDVAAKFAMKDIEGNDLSKVNSVVSIPELTEDNAFDILKAQPKFIVYDSYVYAMISDSSEIPTGLYYVSFDGHTLRSIYLYQGDESTANIEVSSEELAVATNVGTKLYRHTVTITYYDDEGHANRNIDLMLVTLSNRSLYDGYTGPASGDNYAILSGRPYISSGGITETVLQYLYDGLVHRGNNHYRILTSKENELVATDYAYISGSNLKYYSADKINLTTGELEKTNVYTVAYSIVSDIVTPL